MHISRLVIRPNQEQGFNNAIDAINRRAAAFIKEAAKTPNSKIDLYNQIKQGLRKLGDLFKQSQMRVLD